MFSVSRIHRRDAEFAEEPWCGNPIGLGFGLNSQPSPRPSPGRGRGSNSDTDSLASFLCVLCASAVNKYAADTLVAKCSPSGRCMETAS